MSLTDVAYNSNLPCYKNEDHKLNAVWNSSGRREKYLLIIIYDH
jgi:hypothetical protein